MILVNITITNHHDSDNRSYSQSESSSESSWTAGSVIQPEVNEWVRGFKAKHTWRKYLQKWRSKKGFNFMVKDTDLERWLTSKDDELFASPHFPTLQRFQLDKSKKAKTNHQLIKKTCQPYKGVDWTKVWKLKLFISLSRKLANLAKTAQTGQGRWINAVGKTSVWTLHN